MKNCVKYIALIVCKFWPVQQPYYVARQSVNTYCTITKCNYFFNSFFNYPNRGHRKIQETQYMLQITNLTMGENKRISLKC